MNRSADNSFDLYTAHILAQASLEAYYPDQDFFYPSMLPGSERRIAYIPETDTQCIIRWNDTDVILAFRGTQSRENVWTDLECAQMRPSWNGDVKVHSGFNNALDSVWERLLAHLAEAHPSHKALWITGHSLGGALAVLAALRLAWASSMPIAGVYTIGQPRVGDEAFATIYNSKLHDATWRICHDDDGIPLMPFMLGKYRHCGQHALLQPDKVILEPGLWKQFVHLEYSLLEDFKRGHGLGLVYEHHCALYASDIEKRIKIIF